MKFKKVFTPQRMMVVAFILLIIFPLVVSADNAHQNWEIPKGGADWWNPIKDNGGGKLANEAEATAFYQHFSVYLQPFWGIVAKPVALLGGFIIKGLAHLVEVLQQVFYASIKFMTILNDLGNQNTTIGRLYLLMQKLGIIVFGLSIVIYAVFVIFNGKSKIFKNILQTVFLTTLVFSFIPWAVGQTLNLTQDAITETAASSGEKSIALSLIQNNVVDKYAFDALNWQVPLQSDGTVSKPSEYNVIKSIDGWDPSELAGIVTDKRLMSMGEKNNGGATNATVIFEHKLIDQTRSDGKKLHGKQTVERIDKGTFELQAWFGDNYLRYKVNWLALIISLAAVCLLFLTMTIKVGLSVTQITLATISGPVLAAIKASHTKKVKELISNIFHGVLGIYFDFLIVAVAVGIIYWVTSTPVFFDAGLPALAVAILKAVLYIVVFFGVFAGIGAVESFLGVSSGHGNALKQVMAGAMVARAAFSGGQLVGGALAPAGAAISKAGWNSLKNTSGEVGNAINWMRGLSFMPSSSGNNDKKFASDSTRKQTENSQNPNPTGIPRSPNESQRQKEARESLKKEQQIAGQAKDTQEPTHKEEQKFKQAQPFEPAGKANINPIQPEKSRREKAQEKMRQNKAGQGLGSNSNGSNHAQDDLTQEVPQHSGRFSEQEITEETPSATSRIEHLESRMNHADEQKQKEAKAQAKQAYKQKQSQRLQKASQSLSQAGQLMQQLEPHINSIESEE